MICDLAVRYAAEVRQYWVGSLGVLLLSVIATAACAPAPPPAPEPIEIARAREFVASMDATPPVGTWRSGNSAVGMAVSHLEYLTEMNEAVAPAGSRWISMDVTVTNDNPAAIRIDPASLRLVTRNGKVVGYDLITLRMCDQPLRSIEVRPRAGATGCVIFLGDAGVGPARLVYSGAKTRRGTDVVVDLDRFPDRTTP